MSTYILTSMFPNGFNEKTREVFQRLLIKRNKFAFVASEFEKNQEILTEKMRLETSKKLVEEYRNKINELQKRIIELETGIR